MSDQTFEAKEKEHKCVYCSSSFDLTDHVLMQAGKKPLNHDSCEKCVFQLKNSLVDQPDHADEKLNACDICGKTFSSSYKLTRHRRTRHTDEKPHKCETCGKTFITSSKLKRHQKIHTGEKSFSCETCGKRFYESHDLKRHERTHNHKKTC